MVRPLGLHQICAHEVEPLHARHDSSILTSHEFALADGNFPAAFLGLP
jgi:hypothetical protein